MNVNKFVLWISEQNILLISLHMKFISFTVYFENEFQNFFIQIVCKEIYMVFKYEQIKELTTYIIMVMLFGNMFCQGTELHQHY